MQDTNKPEKINAVQRNPYSIFFVALFPVVLVGSLLTAGCSKNEAPSDGPVASNGPGGGAMSGPGGGGMKGPGGGRFAPVAVTATAAEIYPQKCAGCHGDKGQGGRGPTLTKLANDPDDELYNTIHNGKGKMPSFARQMTEAQIKLLVAYVKGAQMAK